MTASVLRLGISQKHGGTTVLAGAHAFANVLGARLQRQARVAVAESYAALYKMVLNNGCDLAWVPPFVHIAATDHGARIIGVCERRGALVYRGAILVRAESDLHTLADLRRRGLTAAWTEKSSAAGYVFPRLFLAAHGVELARLRERFVGAPMACCAAVSDGQADLCPCFIDERSAGDPAQILADVARVYPAARWRLRVLGVTDPIPADAVVLAPHVDPALTAALERVLLTLHESPEGKGAVAKLLYADRLVAPTPAYLAQVAALRPSLPPVE